MRAIEWFERVGGQERERQEESEACSAREGRGEKWRLDANLTRSDGSLTWPAEKGVFSLLKPQQSSRLDSWELSEHKLAVAAPEKTDGGASPEGISAFALLCAQMVTNSSRASRVFSTAHM